MDIGEIIRKLAGGMDPNSAIMGANAAIPPDASAQQQPPPQQPSAPQGVPTPVTNPKPVAQAPQAYQSPSDLANMYVQLMKDNRNAQQLDSGLNLIAAGLSNSPTNRAALIAGASGGHGAGGMSLSANDMINFQKQADAQRNQLLIQQAMPALIKQYKLTPAQAQALISSGQIGDVIKHYSTENLGSTEDAANGQRVLFNQRTGAEVARIGGEKPEEGVYEDTPGGRKLVTKRLPDEGDTKPLGVVPTEAIRTADDMLTRVNAGRPPDKQMTMDEYLKILHPGVSQTVNVNKENYPFVKPDTGYDYERNPDNSVKIYEDGKPRLYKIPGGEPADKAVVTAKETADAAKKERIAKAQTAFAAGNVGNAVRVAFEVADKPGATGFLSKPARALGLGGAPSDDLDKALSTINANTAFTQLKAMREASASGASGLGQLTEKEGQMLSSVIEDLRPYQSTGRFKEGLARVEAAMTLLAGDSFEKGTDLEGFNKSLGEMTQQILAREFNKKSGAGGSKVRVIPR